MRNNTRDIDNGPHNFLNKSQVTRMTPELELQSPNFLTTLRPQKPSGYVIVAALLSLLFPLIYGEQAGLLESLPADILETLVKNEPLLYGAASKDDDSKSGFKSIQDSLTDPLKILKQPKSTGVEIEEPFGKPSHHVPLLKPIPGTGKLLKAKALPLKKVAVKKAVGAKILVPKVKKVQALKVKQKVYALKPIVHVIEKPVPVFHKVPVPKKVMIPKFYPVKKAIPVPKIIPVPFKVPVKKIIPKIVKIPKPIPVPKFVAVKKPIPLGIPYPVPKFYKVPVPKPVPYAKYIPIPIKKKVIILFASNVADINFVNGYLLQLELNYMQSSIYYKQTFLMFVTNALFQGNE
ncbi:hypothetical protein TNCV_413401 [Trichonephila clavipes]|nr:hypothetical protein TNCV_413401 [Trichonephila clavipes]